MLSIILVIKWNKGCHFVLTGSFLSWQTSKRDGSHFHWHLILLLAMLLWLWTSKTSEKWKQKLWSLTGDRDYSEDPGHLQHRGEGGAEPPDDLESSQVPKQGLLWMSGLTSLCASALVFSISFRLVFPASHVRGQMWLSASWQPSSPVCLLLSVQRTSLGWN